MPVFRDGQLDQGEIQTVPGSVVAVSGLTSGFGVVVALVSNTGPATFILADPAVPTRRAEVSPMGELRIAPHVRLVGTPFHGSGVDTNFWTPLTSNSGVVVHSSGNVVLGTTDRSGDVSQLRSVRVGRYIAGVPNYYRGVVQFDPGVSGNIRQWGMFGSSDGMFFEMLNESFGVGIRKAGSDQHITTGFLATPPTDSYYHTYEMYIRSRGADFMIDDAVIYRYTVSSEPMATTLSLPSSMINTNSGTITTSGVRLKAMSAAIHRIGEARTRPRYAFQSNTATTYKVGPGTLHKVIIGSGGSSGNTLAIFDNISNTAPQIAQINMSLSGSVNATTIDFDVDFYTGLTVVQSGGTTAATVTLIYE